MDLLQLQQQERVVPFLRRSSVDWDFLRGQILELEPDEKLFLSSWCKKAAQILEGSLLGLDYEDRLLRLESDKDSLHLQVSVLSDQIDAQTSKIHDLEKCLDDKKNVLESTEDTLQRELLTRSSLETQKLELMTEISSLRLKQAALERENFDLKDRWGGAGRSSVDLHYGGDPRLWEKPPLAHLLRPSSPALSQQPNGIDSGSLQRNRLGNNGTEGSPPKPTRPRTPPANAYRRVEQSAFGTIPRRNPSSQLSAFNNGLCTEGSNGNGTSYSSGNLQAVPYQQQNNGSYIPTAKHPVPFPVQPKSFLGQQELLGSSSGGGGQLGVGGGGGLFFLTDPNSGPRSTSAPNLAAIEREEWERRNNSSNGKTKSPGSGGHKSRGILRILSKLKRSNSGGLENEVAPESLAPFARGGLRSTAAPRLGWLQEPKVLKRPEGPVSSWDCASVILWLDFLGLSMYSTEVKRWVKSGQQLLDASTKELEKELNIKNSLHRKKLSLALYSLKHPEEEDNAGRLDYHWVIRWLDDVGLPQYKETFSEARVDGRVLSALTSDDLILLKVTSQLHHTSIKRGIQLLRIHKFQPSCLCRRGGPAPGTAMINGDGASRGPRHVATWTNHRVMEWLRAIDLSEYAPNLRGSGVHGAVMILEPKFNAELLATFLSIPANKTLLRRHLSLQVNEVVGRHIVHEKRTVELASDFIPISPTTKVKPTKPAKVFNLRKKRQSSDMNEDLLCPLDWNSFPFPNEAHTENLDMPLDRGNNRSDPVSNI